MAQVAFKKGTLASVLSTVKDSNTLYFAEDKGVLYLGNTRISDIVTVNSEPTLDTTLANQVYIYNNKVYFRGTKTEEVAGTTQIVDAVICIDVANIAEEIQAVRDLANSKVASLTAGDASIDLGSDALNPVLKVNIHEVAEGEIPNIVELKSGGLYVPAPAAADTYAVVRDTSSADYSAVYRLMKTPNGTGTPVQVGDDINIPKDMVIESGTLETVTTDDEPYAGAKVGDPYLDLVLANAESSHIYVPVKGLVDIYTAGQGITIENNEVGLKLNAVDANGLKVDENGLGLDLVTQTSAGALSAVDKKYIDELPDLLANKTTQNLQGTNGLARIWNESDGGGVQFQHKDGTWSFVGVNDGGANGITGQLYSVDKNNGNLGTRINMTSDGFFYFKGKTGATQYTADDEIATLGDVQSVKDMLEWGDL